MLKRILSFACLLFIAQSLVLSTGYATVQKIDLKSYPSVDRPWTADDYKQLFKIVAAGQVPLPTLSDPASKDVFERMVSHENAAFIVAKDESLAPDRRLPAVVETAQVIKSLSSQYLLATRYQAKKHEREFAKIIAYSLDLSGLTRVLKQQSLKNLKNHSIDPADLKSLNQIRLDLSKMFSGAVIFVSLPGLFSKASRLELLEALRRNVPKSGIPLDARRTKIIRRITAQLNQTKDLDEKEALVALKSAIIKPETSSE